LPSNLKQTTRECVLLVRPAGHMWQRRQSVTPLDPPYPKTPLCMRTSRFCLLWNRSYCRCEFYIAWIGNFALLSCSCCLDPDPMTLINTNLNVFPKHVGYRRQKLTFCLNAFDTIIVVLCITQCKSNIHTYRQTDGRTDGHGPTDRCDQNHHAASRMVNNQESREITCLFQRLSIHSPSTGNAASFQNTMTNE